MTYKYGAHSVGQRATLHPHLQNIFDSVLDMHDFRIEIGARTAQQQQDAFTGNPQTSKLPGFVDGKEADFPHKPRGPEHRSWAVDVWPYVDGKRLDANIFGKDSWETGRWTYFVGLVEAISRDYFRTVFLQTNEQFRLRWGGNWNRDAKILDDSDRRFVDAYHFEMERVL